MARRSLADQASSWRGHAADPGNQVRLLEDARENCRAWLDTMQSAEGYVLFENYTIPRG